MIGRIPLWARILKKNMLKSGKDTGGQKNEIFCCERTINNKEIKKWQR